MPENTVSTDSGSPSSSRTQDHSPVVVHINIDDLDPVKQQRRNQREFDRERREGWTYG